MKKYFPMQVNGRWFIGFKSKGGISYYTLEGYDTESTCALYCDIRRMQDYYFESYNMQIAIEKKHAEELKKEGLLDSDNYVDWADFLC